MVQLDVGVSDIFRYLDPGITLGTGSHLAQRVNFEGRLCVDVFDCKRIKASRSRPPHATETTSAEYLKQRRQQLLKKHINGIEVNFDTGQTVTCKYSMGTPNSLELQDNLEETRNIHPLDEERSFFQLPQQAAYLNLELEQPPIQWRYCDINIALNCDWPSEIKLSSELFQLFVIPIENKVPDQSQPIQYDGTKSQHLIMPPITDPELRLCNVEGVYQLESGQRIPIRPGILKGGANSYQVFPVKNNEKNKETHFPTLEVNLPQAFHQPVKLVVDGFWYNPKFNSVIGEKITVRPNDLDIAGLDWQLLVAGDKKLAPYIEVSEYQTEQYLELSALKNKSVLSLNEVRNILDSFTTIWKGEFSLIQEKLKRICVLPDKSIAPFERNCLLYIVDFGQLELNLLPMIEVFISHLENILDNWVGQANIKVVAEFNGQNRVSKTIINNTKINSMGDLSNLVKDYDAS